MVFLRFSISASLMTNSVTLSRMLILGSDQPPTVIVERSLSITCRIFMRRDLDGLLLLTAGSGSSSSGCGQSLLFGVVLFDNLHDLAYRLAVPFEVRLTRSQTHSGATSKMPRITRPSNINMPATGDSVTMACPI